MTGNVTYRATGTDHYSYPQFSFRIPIALAKICFSRIVINYAKILLYQQAPSLNSYVRQNRGGGGGMTSPTRHQKPYAKMADIDASINVKPEEGGGPRAYVGHLTSIAFPTLGNLTKNLGPRVGMFAFFARRNGTKSHRPMCSSVRRSSWN